MTAAATITTSEKMEVASKRVSEAREALVSIVGEYATKGAYGSAQRAMELAQKLDEVSKAILALGPGQGNGGTFPTTRNPRNGKESPFPTESKHLPFFYVQGDRLVMRGPGRENGRYYEQRISKPNYDLIVGKLRRYQTKGGIIRNQDLLDRAEMPVHQPGLILKLLASKGVLVPLQKGVYSLADATEVEAAAKGVWDCLPRAGAGTFV